MTDSGHDRHDQLERELEATLARLATRAVPDTSRPPAPPWQQRRTVVDARRFGRATPWLVAAVLLVIAGLGLGATVAFDASAPDRAPVGTEPPSPTATTTVSDGTLGDPTTTPSPTSTPSFGRGTAVVAPDDGISTSASSPPDTGPFVVGVGTYGPVAAGMTQAQALAALGLTGAAVTVSDASCFHDIPLPGDTAIYGTPKVYTDDTTGTVVLINPPSTALDAGGLGVGTTLAALQAAYPDGQLGNSVSGWVFTRFGTGDVGTGYVLSTTSQTPAGTDTVSGVVVGNRGYAQGGELYEDGC